MTPAEDETSSRRRVRARLPGSISASHFAKRLLVSPILNPTSLIACFSPLSRIVSPSVMRICVPLTVTEGHMYALRPCQRKKRGDQTTKHFAPRLGHRPSTAETSCNRRPSCLDRFSRANLFVFRPPAARRARYCRNAMQWLREPLRNITPTYRPDSH